MTDKKTTDEKKLMQEDENIGKIRDILFGNNINEIDQRFNKIEQELQRTIDAVKADIQKKLHSFDDYFKKEISSLIDELKKEERARVELEKNVHKELGTVKDSVDKTNEDLKNSIRELRATIMEHYKENSESIAKVEVDLKNQLNKNVDQLTLNKVDRKMLAMLLSDMALKINERNE